MLPSHKQIIIRLSHTCIEENTLHCPPTIQGGDIKTCNISISSNLNIIFGHFVAGLVCSALGPQTFVKIPI